MIEDVFLHQLNWARRTCDFRQTQTNYWGDEASEEHAVGDQGPPPSRGLATEVSQQNIDKLFSAKGHFWLDWVPF